MCKSNRCPPLAVPNLKAGSNFISHHSLLTKPLCAVLSHTTNSIILQSSIALRFLLRRTHNWPMLLSTRPLTKFAWSKEFACFFPSGIPLWEAFSHFQMSLELGKQQKKTWAVFCSSTPCMWINCWYQGISMHSIYLQRFRLQKPR